MRTPHEERCRRPIVGERLLRPHRGGAILRIRCCGESNIAGWSSLVARRAHNPKVVGSNPAPATNILAGLGLKELGACSHSGALAGVLSSGLPGPFPNTVAPRPPSDTDSPQAGAKSCRSLMFANDGHDELSSSLRRRSHQNPLLPETGFFAPSRVGCMGASSSHLVCPGVTGRRGLRHRGVVEIRC